MKKILFSLMSLTIILGGCAQEKEATEEKKVENQKEQTSQVDKQPENESKQDKELTEKIVNEKGVIGGQVYVQDGTATGTLVLDKSVSDEDGKELAEGYADEIKETYNDLPVNVQAVRDGENVASITRE
ncbi:MAG: hypothetical protein R3267_02905 [Paenisporosarcina sp.]|nr:hypothetical protein [Paenisporosarcina sp.]